MSYRGYPPSCLFCAFIAIASCLSAQIALVRHAPTIDGRVEGSIQQMLPESVNFNGSAFVTEDLRLPGTPTVRLNGKPSYAGTVNGSGAAQPTSHSVTLNGNCTLRNVVRRTDGVALPVVAPPLPPKGTRYVALGAGQSVGLWTTVRNLNLNSGAPSQTVPAGAYGDFSLAGGCSLVLGEAGATQPAVYHFQRLSMNGQAELRLVGPVILNVANDLSINGQVGASAHPAWLTLNMSGGGCTLNGGAALYGYINAPKGTVIINGNSRLVGGVCADRLVVNGNGVLRLQSPNQPPSAEPLDLTTPEDTALDMVLRGSDPEGSALSYTILTKPSHGSLTGAGANWVYAPAPEYSGTDSFTYSVSDGALTSTTAVVSIVVTPVNDAPTALAQSITIHEDTAVAITLQGADAEGSALHYVISTGPIHGTLSGEVPHIVYTPSADYFGSDSFTFTVDDGELTSAPALVDIKIVPVNDAPVALPVAAETQEDLAVRISPHASDPENTVLSYAIVSAPSHGTLRADADDWIYTPSANFHGIDSFRYRVTDGELSSDPAAVTITILPVNDAPVADVLNLTTNEDTVLPLLFTGSDVDGDTLTYRVVAGPTKGTLSGEAPALTYIPSANVNGVDHFTYVVNDGATDSAPATVTISITPVNDAPVPAPVSVRTPEDTPVSVLLSAADEENDPLTFTIGAAPAHGELSGAAPDLLYTPAKDFSGTDSFTYTVSDGASISAAVTVSIIVDPVNDAPVAQPLAVETQEDVAVQIEPVGSDPEGSPLSFEVVDQPAHGSLVASATAWTYLPSPNYNGDDSFSYRASDGSATSAPAIVGIIITPENDAPVANASTVSTRENMTSSFVLSATDNDGDSLVYTVVTAPQHGILSGTAPSLVYTPAKGFSGEDSLTFSANDGVSDSNLATVAITVINNQPPVVTLHQPLAGDTFRRGDTVTFTADASDVDGTVMRVEFWVDGKMVAQSTAAPYTGTWAVADTVTLGDHTVLAVAYDNQEGIGYSEPGAGSGPLFGRLNWVLPCYVSSADGPCPSSSESQFVLDGRSDLVYDITLHIRGIVEGKGYSGGVADGWWMEGGTPDSSPFNIYCIEVSSPYKKYYLNNYQSYISEVYLIDYVKSIKASGGATIKLTAAALDGREINNHRKLVVPDVTSIQQPYNGQFVVLDVVREVPSGRVIKVVEGNRPPVVEAGSDQIVYANETDGFVRAGKLVVCSDEWYLSDRAFAQAPTTAQFARNLLHFFAKSPQARFLARCSIGYRAFAESSFINTLKSEGYSLTVDNTTPMTLDYLEQFDAVFVDGAFGFDASILTQYIQRGGGALVTVASGAVSPDVEAQRMNKFIEPFGLRYAPTWNGFAGTVPVLPGTPLSTGVDGLFFENGNSISIIEEDDSSRFIIQDYNGAIMMAGFQGFPRASLDLKGTVQDDGLPLPSKISSAWSVVSGLPSAVEFYNAYSIETRVGFTQPGTYVLQLSASDGEFTGADSLCVTVVSNKSPTVRFLAPVDGAVSLLTSGVPLVADANDIDGSVAKVEFFVENSASGILKIGEATQSPYSLMWSPSSTGKYTLIAAATDALGAKSTDARFEIQVVDQYHPAVSIMRPTTGTAVLLGRNSAIEARASDSDGAINEVIFYAKSSIDTEPVLVGRSSTAPYTITWTPTVVGSYEITAVAMDDDGATTTSAAQTISVVPGEPPAVIITAPDSGANLRQGHATTLVASATDPDGSVAKVEFFAKGPADSVATKLGESLVSPYSVSWTPAALGAYELTAVATDNDGISTTSAPCLVSVVDGTPPVVAITAPASGSSVALNQSLAITANAADEDGSISKVVFFAQSASETSPVKVGESTVAPYGVTWTPTVAGPYILTATATDNDGRQATSPICTVTAVAGGPPTVAMTSPVDGATLIAGRSTTLWATAGDADGAIASVEFFDGSTKLGNAGQQVGQPGVYGLTRSAGFTLGAHTLSVRATDDSGYVATATIQITAVTDPGTAPEASVPAIPDGTVLTAPTPIIGTASSPILASYHLEYRPLTSDGSGTWVEFASGTSSVTDGVLGTFDPTLLLNGLYELRLRVIDAAGRMVTQGPISVVVDGGMKLGHFSVAFQDLSIAAGGLPLEIVRSYDSRDTSVGDFGPGWRIALNGIRVQKSRNLGDDWQQSKSGHSLGVVYSVEPTQTHLVTVRFPDGETHRFEAGVYVPRSGGPVLPDNYQWLVPIEEARLVFKPMGETTSTLAVEGDNTVYLTGFLGEDFLTQGMAGIDESFNPTRFRLTTKDGSVFLLDEKLGLLEMHDPSGNQVALQRDSQNRVSAIVSTQSLSAAQGGAIARTVTIHRDSAGRVDYIEDLAGRQLDYFYDSQGRLSSFADREGNITTFLYENAKFPYYLTKILDPLGRAALRCEFDDAGRLIKQIDAKGNETVFARGLDATGSFQKVQDRLGHETTYYYDDRGNVTLKLDAEGAATSYTYYPDSDRAKFETDHYGNTKSFAYDAKGNVTVETVGASLSDDPANPTTGYTTRTTYDSHGSPLSMVDPDGRATTFSYDANGNLLTYTAGADLSAPTVGQKTSYTYYDDGSIDTITDALGNTTRHVTEYGISDARFPGAVRRQTVTVTDVARGVLRTTHTYFDEQGNQLAQLATRTLPDATTEDVITRYRYDADNRLVATIQPDGRVSKTRYNAVGKEVKTLEWRTVADYTSADESLARVTSYAYDEAGNLTSTTYADGSTEATGYDAEAHRTWSQDRLGHRTFYLYDKVGRLRFTLLPDDNDGVGASAPTSATDPRLQDNPRTETVYDLAGRALKQIDEAGRVTETRYYADGTPDAGRREKVILGSGTSLAATTTYQYNASGAVRFVTDPRGNTTETQYDNQGRVRYVIYPATDEHPATRTETQYDPLGRRSAVIDQEGNTTRYRYDALGRLLEVRQYLDKSLAAGDADFHLAASTTGVVSTRHAYDELGRQVTQTDALGRATTYWTDSLGRRTRRLLPKEATESTALTEQLDYDAWGYLAHRTDFAGKTTTYAYDTLGRLKSRTADATHPSLAYSHAIARVEYDYDASGARTAARTYSAGSTLLYAEATPRTERGAVDYKQTALGTLDYTYAATGQLEDVVSSNAHGVNIGYRYDALGRLQYVDDGSTGALRTHGYTYNANGSLETVTYATGLTHRYAYDALNRLRTLSVGYGTTTLHGYEYKLRASGHRHQIVEATGRTATYGYDALYRLTGETIAGDPAGQNGTVTYGLDSVGNRLTRTSSVPAVASAANTFNARDWLASDTYDANGNTTAGLNALGERSTTDIYDFENRLILRLKSDGTQLSLSYDADGNRIQKTRFDVSAQPVSTTSYLVDTNNATGYAQVVEERTFEISNPASQITKVYTYGADLISRSEISDAQIANTLYYLYDGLGSVRALSDESGTLTDTYSYDAFGNLIARTGSTDNAYLYRGEQWDADLGLYYNRARYLNPDSGRFWSMDSYEGSPSDPASLHKYLYANANPIAYDDPSGNFSFGEMGSVLDSIGSLARMVVPSVIQRFGTTIAFNIFRASFVAEKALLWLDIGTAIVGGTLFVADSVDRMAENLLNNSNSINDGPFPQSAGRGSQIERIANPNLGGNVNIIDDLDGGVGTSIRSHGLGGDERAYLNAIHADVREVESAPTSRIFGTSKDGRYVNFPAGTVKQPALLVGVPQNHARMLLSPTFRSALENYRAAYGVVVRVVPVRGWIKR